MKKKNENVARGRIVDPRGLIIGRLTRQRICMICLRYDTIQYARIRNDAINYDMIQFDVVKWDTILWNMVKWDMVLWNVIK